MYDLALSARRGPAAFTPPLPILDLPAPFKHPIAAPAIDHGGHDQVSGQEGVEALQRNVLPIYKVWSWSDDEREKRKAHKAKMEKKAIEKLKKERDKERANRKGGNRLGW